MPTVTYTPHPEVLATALDDGETVLLHLARGRYYSLNESGSLLWRRLPAAPTTPALAAALGEVYDVTPAEAEATAAAWLAEMCAAELVRAHEAA